MKKIAISILVLILCSVMFLGGCTKADNATIEMINNLYATTVQNYQIDAETHKTKVFDQDGRVDLYSADSYNGTLSSLINSKGQTEVENDTSMSKFNLLKVSGEYQVIIQAITDFFAKKSYNYTFIDVPQQMHTKLYNAVDNLSSTLNKLVLQKQSLEATLQNFGVANANEVPVQESFKLFLKQYDKLIAKLYQVNKTFEEIYTGYIHKPETVTQLSGGVPEYETGRLVLSSELYLAEYYYQKHMVLSSAYETQFASKYIGTTANQNYDSIFANFVKIVTNVENVAEPADRNDADVITYYNACLQKFDSLKTNLKNYEKAVSKIVEYKNSHTKPIDEKSSVYHYVEFIEEFDAEVMDYQNYLIARIMKLAD